MPLIDLHIDTLGRMLDTGADIRAGGSGTHVDLPRLEEHAVVAAVWAACSAFRYSGLPGTAASLRMLARGVELARRAEGRVRLVLSGGDLDACVPGGPIGMVLALEGAEPLEGSLEMLRAYHDLGVRVLTLTWNGDTPFACGCGLRGGEDRGLSPLGRELLGLCAELGVVLDLAHASPRTLSDAIACGRGPFLVSHTACAALRPHPRNLTDAQLREVAAAGGVVGITICPAFLAGEGEVATRETWGAHVRHALAVAGEDHVAVGTDFDGVESLPEGVRGIEDLPGMRDDLAAHGVSAGAIARVSWVNALRVLRGIGEPRAGWGASRSGR